MITHLVDTSVLTRLSKPEVRLALQPFVDAVALARCTMSDLELGFSASNAHEWDTLQSLLHYDQDFELIASVTGQAHMWIVPRGSVD